MSIASLGAAAGHAISHALGHHHAHRTAHAQPSARDPLGQLTSALEQAIGGGKNGPAAKVGSSLGQLGDEVLSRLGLGGGGGGGGGGGLDGVSPGAAITAYGAAAALGGQT